MGPGLFRGEYLTFRETSPGKGEAIPVHYLYPGDSPRGSSKSLLENQAQFPVRLDRTFTCLLLNLPCFGPQFAPQVIHDQRAGNGAVIGNRTDQKNQCEDNSTADPQLNPTEPGYIFPGFFRGSLWA